MILTHLWDQHFLVSKIIFRSSLFDGRSNFFLFNVNLVVMYATEYHDGQDTAEYAYIVFIERDWVVQAYAV